jgi:hypothetical protein
MRQVLARTVVRRLRREVLGNGTTEAPLWTLFTGGDHIVRWAWRTPGKPGMRVAELLARRPAGPVVRLCGRRQVTRWVRDHLGPATLWR